MSTLTLEFRYCAHHFTTEDNFSATKLTIHPIGELAHVFPKGFVYEASAIDALSPHQQFSFAAGMLKASARHLAGKPVTFSKTASFKDNEGRTTIVTPATFTQH